MWLSKFNYKTRLIFGFGVFIIVNLILLLFIIKYKNEASERLITLYNHPFVVSNALRDINNERSNIRRTFSALHTTDNKKTTDSLVNSIDQSDVIIKKKFKNILNLYLGDKDEVLKAQSLYFDWERERDKELILYIIGNREAALKIHDSKVHAEFETKLFKQTQILIDFARNKAAELYALDIEEENKSKNILIGFFIFSFILSFVVASIISRSIAVPLIKLSQRIQKHLNFKTEGVKFHSEYDVLEYSVSHLENMSEVLLDFNKKLEKEVAIKSKDLFEKNQFFEKMMAKSPLAFIYFDTDYKVQIWNPAAETIFGYTAKEAIGKNILNLIVSDDIKKEIHELVESVFDASAKQNQQNENITKSGKRIMCNWYNTAIKDENDKVIGLSSIVEDITKRTKMTEDLKITNESLQEMVYVASHDLQVPLVSMEGFASEVLTSQKDKLDEEGVYCLTRLQSNVQRMHKLVLSLLDVSRLNTHINQYEKFNLNTVIDKIVEDLTLTFEKNKATINYKKLPTIYADKQRIESVMRNLITNALNYNGKNIAITFKEDILAVADDGIGIPKDQLNKIFFPGERLKMNKAEGVGMGLTFCDKVIKRHQGSIWAASKGVNKGTTINIKFNKTTLIV